MTGCPFCKRIAAGEFDYSDEHSVAFQPLNPVTPGHFLVVPRTHVVSALEPLAPILLGGAMRLAVTLARQMDLTACNFINSAGAAATQSVPHLHVHVVPRREGDGLRLPWTGQRPLCGPASPVEELWLKAGPAPARNRCVNMLHRAGIRRVGDLTALTLDDIQDIRWLGVVAITEIQRALAANGLALAECGHFHSELAS